MKKYLIPIVSALVFGVLATSCDKAVNLDPTTTIKADDVWGSADGVNHYVYGLYQFIKETEEVSNYNQAAYTDAYADLLKSGSWNQYGHSYNTAMMQESTFSASSGAGPFECWTYCYGYIRRCNEFLRDADIYESKFKYSKEQMNAWRAEVKMIRGYAYFRLMVLYGNIDENEDCPNGGVPLRVKVDGPAENDLARSSWDASWNQVISDFEFAARNLPDAAPSSGRFSKAAAFGFLSRAALHARRWERVVSAADSCKLSGGVLDDSYSHAINEASSPENLLAVYYTTNGNVSHRAETFFRPIGDKAFHNQKDIYGVIGATAELVDEYEMSDGSEFSWSDCGDEPFTNREPRFYASIIYNGAKWEGRTVELYTDGADAWDKFNDSGTSKSTPTGYYFKKFIIENSSSWEVNGSNHFGPFLRYAEVLLNKAEAYAEMGNVGDACEALNEVRGRVNLPGRDTEDYDEFMQYLRHERIVELAGEGFRMWDLRRWRLAEEVLNGANVHGTFATKNADGSFTYKTEDADAGRTRIFPSRYYAFSIPEDEVKNNFKLGPNNPGW